MEHHVPLIAKAFGKNIQDYDPENQRNISRTYNKYFLQKVIDWTNSLEPSQTKVTILEDFSNAMKHPGTKVNIDSVCKAASCPYINLCKRNIKLTGIIRLIKNPSLIPSLISRHLQPKIDFTPIPFQPGKTYLLSEIITNYR